MNKITSIALSSVLACSPLYAGGMGGDQLNSGFFSLEGGYATNQIDNYNFTFLDSATVFSSAKKEQHYAGRLAAGLLAMMDDQVGMTTEIAWGYYGKTTLSTVIGVLDDLSIQNTIYGFDILVGLSWIQSTYSVSLKAGAMIQNLQREFSVAISDPTFPSVTAFTAKTNQSAALPEIKVTGAFNFDPNWALTLSALYAVGRSTTNSALIDSSSFSASFVANSENPSVGAILFGIQYTC